MEKVKYLPHPCSTELKKEWNAKGYRVLDERFNPTKPEDVEVEQPKKTRKATK